MSKWTPITKALPKEGQLVDIWVNGERYTDVVFSKGKFLQWDSFHLSPIDYIITHWMKVPNPPKLENN